MRERKYDVGPAYSKIPGTLGNFMYENRETSELSARRSGADPPATSFPGLANWMVADFFVGKGAESRPSAKETVRKAENLSYPFRSRGIRCPGGTYREDELNFHQVLRV